MTSKDLIQEFASKLEVTPEQLAADIHALCAWIQEQGNRGYTELQLKDAGLPVYILSADKALYDRILFHAEGERRKDYHGWGVKRQPMVAGEIFAWEETWLMRFGWLDNDLTKQVRAKINMAENPGIQVGDWVEYKGGVLRVGMIQSNGQFVLENIYGGFSVFAKRDELVKVDAPRRNLETFSGGGFSAYSTFEIAYRMACAVVLADWYTNARFHETYSRVYPHREAVTVWREQYRILRNELVYRTHAAPEKGSKKKTKEAAEDWAKAAEYLEKGTLYFFSREFLKVVTESPEYPDLSIDPDHLPKLLPERIPVAWKSDRELFSDVLKWLDKDIDPASFEYEDREKFIDIARRWIATARGEGVR